jgi:YgiT-type zinc finger domain-containing protein
MGCDICGGTMVEQQVTYRIELDDTLVVIENLPARVCLQCGETLYSAETVEQLQGTAWQRKNPLRVLETPVFDFAQS